MSAAVELLACVTCGGSAQRDADGLTRGERLLRQLEQVRSDDDASVTVGSGPCLWACKRSCAVHLRSPGRVGYVLVELEESAAVARALLDYAALYGRSETGAVPFREWPMALRGHFMCRLPATPPPAAELSRAAARNPDSHDRTE